MRNKPNYCIYKGKGFNFGRLSMIREGMQIKLRMITGDQSGSWGFFLMSLLLPMMEMMSLSWARLSSEGTC